MPTYIFLLRVFVCPHELETVAVRVNNPCFLIDRLVEVAEEDIISAIDGSEEPHVVFVIVGEFIVYVTLDGNEHTLVEPVIAMEGLIPEKAVEALSVPWLTPSHTGVTFTWPGSTPGVVGVKVRVDPATMFPNVGTPFKFQPAPIFQL